MSFRIGKLGRTEIWLHGATVLFAAYLIAQGQGLLLAVAGTSIALHECAHGAVAALFRQPASRAEITPLGLMLCLEDEERLTPWQRLGVLAAGPGMTGLLVWLALLLTRAGWLPSAVGRTAFFGNLALLVLNLLPALPLDGGRLLAALLAFRWPLAAQMKVLRITGSAIGGGLVVLSILAALWWGDADLSLTVLGCFLLYAAQKATTTVTMAALRQFLRRRTALEMRGLQPCETLAVLRGTPLRVLLTALREARTMRFLVLAEGTLKPLGMAEEEALHRVFLEKPDGHAGDLLAAEE